MRNTLVVIAIALFVVISTAGMQRCGADGEADLALLDQRLEDFKAHMLAGDVDALMAMYTKEIPVVVFMTTEELRGWEEVRASYEKMFASYTIEDISFENISHRMARNLAVSYGTWTMTMTYEGRQETFNGRFTTTMGRGATGWETLHEHVSMPYRPTPPQPAPDEPTTEG